MEYALLLRHLRRPDHPRHRAMDQQAIPQSEHVLHPRGLLLILPLHGHGQLDADRDDPDLHRPLTRCQKIMAGKVNYQLNFSVISPFRSIDGSRSWGVVRAVGSVAVSNI